MRLTIFKNSSWFLLPTIQVTLNKKINHYRCIDIIFLNRSLEIAWDIDPDYFQL